MPETLGAAPLVTAIESLRTALESTPLDLAIGGGAESRRERTAVIGQIQDYLLPRLQRLDAPLLTVVGGSTGAGKSTLVNGLVGTTVTLSLIHISEPTRLRRISYAVFCLKKK